MGLRYADDIQGVCTCWADLMEIQPGEEDKVDIVAAYDEGFYKGVPAVTRHRYGPGAVYYVGCVLDRTGYRRLAGDILTESGMEHMEGLPVGVEVCYRKKPGETYQFVFNNTDKEQTFFQTKPAMEFIEGNVEEGEIQLAPFQMKIYREEM